MNLNLKVRKKFSKFGFIGRILIVTLFLNGCDGGRLAESQSFAKTWSPKDFSEELDPLDSQDTTKFFRSIRKTLPLYIEDFKSSAEINNLPWQLVAAVAYQESHWNPQARSSTGVRGLMQLTTNTADHMEIKDRINPQESIKGGAKYLRYLLDMLPKSINTQDQIHFALAAYNIGLGHLKDAQKLAEQLGYNPNSWFQVREILPLLADREYSEKLEFGFARGYEAVQFVDRVNSFYYLMRVTG